MPKPAEPGQTSEGEKPPITPPGQGGDGGNGGTPVEPVSVVVLHESSTMAIGEAGVETRRRDIETAGELVEITALGVSLRPADGSDVKLIPMGRVYEVRWAGTGTSPEVTVQSSGLVPDERDMLAT